MNSKPRWRLAKRITFRFVFAYFVLYIIPFPVEIVPFASVLVQKYNAFWQAIVPWVGKHLLRLRYDISIFTNGSGDTPYNYVQVLCLLTLAVFATAIWLVLDRRRLNYEKLYRWLRLFVRFSLASAMIGYGAFKADRIRAFFLSSTRKTEHSHSGSATIRSGKLCSLLLS